MKSRLKCYCLKQASNRLQLQTFHMVKSTWITPL
uniref:Uncharacterized protein n=1 Tax=Arundo donax TaxID=35708 RepID=A0A0A9BUB5_ARUDO